MANEDILWDYPLADTLEGRLYAATLSRIKALKLPCIDPTNIIGQTLAWLFDNTSLKFPCVIVSVADDLINWREGTNEKDQLEFGVFVTLALANPDVSGNRGVGLQMEWRRKIRQSFQNLSLGRFTEFTQDSNPDQYRKSNVENGAKYLEAAKRMQLDANYFLIRHTVAEGRQT